MMKLKNSINLRGIVKLAALCAITFAANNCYASGFFPFNAFLPYDINLRPERWHGTRLQFSTFFEHGLTMHAYNGDHKSVNPLQIWQPTQDAVAMFKGFGENALEMDPDIGVCSVDQRACFFVDTLGSPRIDPLRGNFRVTGDIAFHYATGLSARYHFPYNLTLGLHIPVYSASLKNVNILDLTGNFDEESIRVKRELTSQLRERFAQFDPDLKLDGWNRTGIGDVTLLGEWIADFAQQKPFLKSVLLNTRFGFILPTGLKSNINELFSVPFGSDGSWGIVFGGGIRLNWINFLHAGLDVQFFDFFGNTRLTRIKTDPAQTDLFLLAKTRAHRDIGFTELFNLYCEVRDVFCGFNAGFCYQFWQHNDDKLYFASNDYSNLIANTAESLAEWSIHQLIFRAGYDFQNIVSDCSWFKPQVMAFYKTPFNAKRRVVFDTCGIGFSLSF